MHTIILIIDNPIALRYLITFYYILLPKFLNDNIFFFCFENYLDIFTLNRQAIKLKKVQIFKFSKRRNHIVEPKIVNLRSLEVCS